jgi:hypothetical protein
VQQAMHIGMLCEKFHCLPSDLLKEDYHMVWLLTIYLDAVHEREQKEAEEQEKKAKQQQAKRPRR